MPVFIAVGNIWPLILVFFDVLVPEIFIVLYNKTGDRVKPNMDWAIIWSAAVALFLHIGPSTLAILKSNG